MNTLQYVKSGSFVVKFVRLVSEGFHMPAETNNLVKDIRKMPEATTVVLAGEVDLHHSPALHSALVEVTAERPKRLLVDLRDVPYMDSSGVGTLVEVFRRVSNYKGKMILFGLNPRVKSVFEITKLDKFFTICDTEEQAAKASQRNE